MFIVTEASRSNDGLFAEGTLEFDFEPVIDALAVELMSTIQGLHHVPRLQFVQADRAVILLPLLLLVLKRIVRVYHLTDLLR